MLSSDLGQEGAFVDGENLRMKQNSAKESLPSNCKLELSASVSAEIIECGKKYMQFGQ